jgi:hypothetical protein
MVKRSGRMARIQGCDIEVRERDYGSGQVEAISAGKGAINPCQPVRDIGCRVSSSD